jgi:hypothetical protein
MIFCSIWNFLGNSPITGQTFLVMGLYFFLVDKNMLEKSWRCFLDFCVAIFERNGRVEIQL